MLWTLLAGLSMAVAAPARAQIAAETAQAAVRYNFSIPPQPLTSALPLFGQQSGRQVTADSDAVRGVGSPGVQGSFTIEEALQRLLAGTGLTYSIGAGAVISVQRVGQIAPGAMQLDPVQVQGYPVPPQAMIDNVPPPFAGGQVATGGQLGFLGNRDIWNTPFNQTSYTARRVQDEQARTVRDVLADDPSVRALWPSGSSSADLMMVRGFFVQTPDMGYGGLYGILPYWSVAPQMAERVELLKGPSTFLNGMPANGSLGGTVNIVPKRAGNEPITQGTVSYASGAQFGGAVDIARRFGDDKQFGMRFNGVYRDGATAVQWNNESLALGVLNLDFRSDRVRLAVDLGYQREHIDGLVSYMYVPAGVYVPSPPDASRAFGQPWSYADRIDAFGALRGEFDVTDRITLYASFGVRDNRTSSLEGGNTTVNNINGNFSATPFAYRGFFLTQTGEAGVRGSFDTGPISHAVNLNVTGLWQQSGTAQLNGTPFASNIYNPIFMPQPYPGFPIAAKTSDTSFTSFAFADTLSALDNRIQLTVGGRQQAITANNYAAGTGLWASGYAVNKFSPSAALVIKPWQNVSLYGNYIEGLQQGTIVGAGFANAGQVLPPFQTKQYEAGVKVDWGKFGTTLSAFQISQPTAILNAATNTIGVNGEQRNQGIEFNVFGEPMEGVRLLGGFMLIDARLTKTASGLQDGWQANGVPSFQANIGGEWDTSFVRGLTLNGRVLYTGAEYLNLSSPRASVPDWARLDLGARYRFERPDGKPLTLRFNVENVLNTNYYSAAVNPIFVVQGPPRTFLLSLTADF